MSTAGRTALITGERGTGKTTLGLYLAKKMQHVGGIACPGIFEKNGEKAGFRACCVHSGESWDLGRVNPGSAPPKWFGKNDGGESSQKVGKYQISGAGLRKAIACIRKSLENEGGITLIDEIGPLELTQGKGFAPVLPLLSNGGDLLIVVRPECVNDLLPYLDRHQWCCFQLTEHNRIALRDDVPAFFTTPR